MTVKISSTGRVACQATIALPLSARTVWGQLRDFRSSAMHDPFHAEIVIDGAVPRVGAQLKIAHRYVLARSDRVGRILRWNEGVGFAFSDLCASDPGRAFPHVLSYQVQEVSPNSCQLRVFVGGKWTARGPRWIGRVWL